MVVALGVGAIGNLVAAAITGVDAQWDISATTFAQIVLANELGMLLGFALGLLFRNSPAAIVGYFVVNLVLPGLVRCARRGAGVVGGQRRLVRPQPDPLPPVRLHPDRPGVGPARRHLRCCGSHSRCSIGLRLVLRSEVK